MHHRRLINEASDLSGSSPAFRGFTFILDKPTTHNLHPAVTHAGGGTSSVGWMLRIHSCGTPAGQTDKQVCSGLLLSNTCDIHQILRDPENNSSSYSSVMYVGGYEQAYIMPTWSPAPRFFLSSFEQQKLSCSVAQDDSHIRDF